MSFDTATLEAEALAPTPKAALYLAAFSVLGLEPMDTAPKDRPLVVAALFERDGGLRLCADVVRYGDHDYAWGPIWWPAHYMDAGQTFRPDEAIGWRLPTDEEDRRGGEQLLAKPVAEAMLAACAEVA